jgi:hypothetical protein
VHELLVSYTKPAKSNQIDIAVLQSAFSRPGVKPAARMIGPL